MFDKQNKNWFVLNQIMMRIRTLRQLVTHMTIHKLNINKTGIYYSD